ncbi:MAG: DUF58 domain-containing protein [Myxococcales bacterium]|nr:DUF58 domain-containing protein [Myxococcales bacterium]
MQLHPTRATFHVALAGAAMVAVGIAARVPAVIAFGGAMVLAIGIGRAMALTTVTRIRASGFEMVWSHTRRVSRTARGGEVQLSCELRNRGVDDALGVNVRAVASSMLDVAVTPETIDLPAGSRVRLDVVVRPRRVGRWGLHGMALEVRGTPIGGEGLYEVPLMFANPHGIEVFPRSLLLAIQSPRGGRARRSHEAGRPSHVAGEGDELRELRELAPGDPFKRIAWKASARRAKLMVREMERDQRDVVWLLLDASVELWAGAPGRAPLDQAVDEVASLAAHHLAKGDQVGLVVVTSRVRTWIAPAGGAAHRVRLASALASAASMIDADRTELDEVEVAARVAEHLRPLDPRGLADIPRGNLDMLAARGEGLRGRAPFAPRLPFAKTQREQRLRHYLASFGVEVPPRLDGERDKSEAVFLGVLDGFVTEKKRPSIVHVWARVPERSEDFAKVMRKLRAKRIGVRWCVPALEESVGDAKPVADPISAVVEDAVRVRARALRVRSERALRRLGVRAKALEARGVAPPTEGLGAPKERTAGAPPERERGRP